MRRQALSGYLFLFVVAFGTAWQWPVPDPVVVETFGHNHDGAFQRGMLVAGGVQSVYPVVAGEIVYVHGESDPPPSGMGNYVVVEHDHGFRSLYAHLDSVAEARAGMTVDETTSLGAVGESGIVMGHHLEFYILDTENQVYVNPLLLLPPLPDTRSPAVVNVYAQTADWLFLLSETNELPRGEYQMLIECVDRFAVTRDQVHSPYRIEVFRNGQRQFALKFDMIAFQAEDVVRPSNHGTHDEIYADVNLYRAGKLNVTGVRTDIEIVVADFAGNESTASFSITEPGHDVDEDIQ